MVLTWLGFELGYFSPFQAYLRLEEDLFWAFSFTSLDLPPLRARRGWEMLKGEELLAQFEVLLVCFDCIVMKRVHFSL